MFHRAHVMVFPLGGDKPPKTQPPGLFSLSVLLRAVFSVEWNLFLSDETFKHQRFATITQSQCLYWSCDWEPCAGFYISMGTFPWASSYSWVRVRQNNVLFSTVQQSDLKKTFLLMGANPAGISGHFVPFLPLRWHRFGCCPRVCRTDNSRPWNSFKHPWIPRVVKHIKALDLKHYPVLAPLYAVLCIHFYSASTVFLFQCHETWIQKRHFPYVLMHVAFYVVSQTVKNVSALTPAEKRKQQNDFNS